VRILDRYVLREFLIYLALGLAGFIAIFVVVDIFEKIDVFLDHRAPLPLVTRFYLYRAPEVVVQVFRWPCCWPPSSASASSTKFGELTAMRASGRSILRILAPVFGAAAGTVLVALLLSEFVVPGANRERDRIFDEQIQHLRRETHSERPTSPTWAAAGASSTSGCTC